MNENLIELPVGRLLQKFGAGNHKPGSGSAAALQGMLSAQLIRTVINLTNDEKRRDSYKEWLSELIRIDSEIENRIYPALERLFQEDSVQFDKVIKLRKDREDENDSTRKNQLAARALQELKPATEMPIEIAKLCKELCDFAGYVFDHGFKSARGDSGVALNGAVSAIAGCLSIVDLNLISFDNDEWTENIRLEVNRLRFSCKALSSKTTVQLDRLKDEADQKKSFSLEIDAICTAIRAESKVPGSHIEDNARKLQRTLWKNRNLIWKNHTPDDPIDILKPEALLKILGYQFDRSTTLGQHEIQGSIFEIAGLIDKQQKKVAISEQFPLETQNFTAAHELGHALMHEQSVLHRDRALDGSALQGSRAHQEVQADKFASYFLMPRKLTKRVFQDLFLTERFIVNDDTAFALNAGSARTLKAQSKDLRGLARILASAEYFNGRNFSSISKQFRVSVEAMAIRLEELELLEV
jgi:formiminotetrahydrofolate cyclodeaminase/Zn-dependent peptidase ImmA (M78 family)